MNTLKRSTRTLFCSAALFVTALLSACGGGDQGRDPILGLPAATLVSVSVTPAAPAVLTGGAQQFVATASYSDGTSRDVSTISAWSSASPAVASVGAASGRAVGLAPGSAVISASFNAKAGNATLSVTAPIPVPVPVPTLSSIAVTPATASIAVAASQAFVAIGTFSDGSTAVITNTVIWSSASSPVANILLSGSATGISAGTSLITATSGTKSGTALLTVTAPIPVPVPTLSSIAVTPATASIAVAASQPFVAIGTFSDGSTAVITNTVIWSSGSSSVANIVLSGSATGISAGTSLITATSGTKSGTALLTVTAIAVPPVVIPPVVIPPVVIPPVSTGVNLGSAASFGVLAGTSITNNSGGTTLITGDVGSPSQTTDPVQAAGFTNYKSGAILAGALADLQVAITDANSRTCTVSSASGIDLGGLVLTPGVYCYAGSITITGTFTMNGPGLYIFRTASTLDSSANSIVALTGGASAADVWWVPTAPTTLGANSVFKGTVMGQSAAITMGDNATLLNGRVLSAAAVTLRNNQITK